MRAGEDWQHAGWEFFDTVPEYHQGCVIVGSLLSKARLRVMENGKETKNAVALAALAELFGGPEGQVEMLRQFGIHFSVAGGGWIAGPEEGQDRTNPKNWLVAATTEVSKTAGTWKINGKARPGSPVMIEIWKPHPRDPKKYDSPTRAVLPVLSELHQLTKRVAAQIDSRLSGNGILFVPSETNFPAAPATVQNAGDPPSISLQPTGAQGFADLLESVAEIAIQDPENAKAMIPLIATTPGEYIKAIRHVTFWSELDKAAPKMREESIRRIALGLDMPPEILLGNAGSNHWNAWLSDENSIKIHAEPLLKILTSGLSEGYLWPALEGEAGISNPKAFTIEADTSKMRMRPNRSKEALELNESMKLSDEAALRENGFDAEDAMDAEGIKRAILRKMASGSTTPEIVNAAAKVLGVDLGIVIEDHRPPAEARPEPSLAEHPVRELPKEPPARNAAELMGLEFAAEQMVDRALQRAGNRLKTKYALKDVATPANRLYQAVNVSPADMDDLLKDAWDCTHSTADLVPPADMARALDIYTRSIIASKDTPTRAGIAGALMLLLRRNAA